MTATTGDDDSSELTSYSCASRLIRHRLLDRPMTISPTTCTTSSPIAGEARMAKSTFRVVTRGTDGSLRIKDYPSKDSLLSTHTQIGVDDCSTNLALRGLPVFRGLIGPMSEGKNIVRYESPEVFESLTKEWSSQKPVRKRRRRTAAPEAADASESVAK